MLTMMMPTGFLDCRGCGAHGHRIRFAVEAMSTDGRFISSPSEWTRASLYKVDKRGSETVVGVIVIVGRVLELSGGLSFSPCRLSWR